jgi:alpha-1,3-rhamnosyl/mannosyltransferase
MRILIDGKTLHGQRTGIGWYTHRLLLALSSQIQVEELGVACGGRIIDARTALSLASPPARAFTNVGRRLAGALRSAASDFVPMARDLLSNVQAIRMRRKLGEWHVFHQPNYVSPQLPLPLVTTVCDVSFTRCPQWLPRERRLWLQRSLEKCLKRSRAIATISNFTRNELLSHFPQIDSERVFITPLGVDHQRFRPECGSEDTTLHQRLEIPPRFVLYLGTLEPRKNLQGLLSAYAKIPRSMQREFPLVLAGVAGWKRKYFQPQLNQLKRQGVVRTLGYVSQYDVPALLRAADLFVFPSFYEGFGLPVLEAAACGTPVICSRTTSLPEVMADAASYIDPTEPEEIAAELIGLLDHSERRERLRLAGLKRAKCFSWQQCAIDTMRAYRAAA